MTGRNGGAICNNNGASLTVTSCTFIDNEATGGRRRRRHRQRAVAPRPVSSTTFLDNEARQRRRRRDRQPRRHRDLQRLGRASFTGNFASGDGGAIDATLGALNVTKATSPTTPPTTDGGAVDNVGARRDHRAAAGSPATSPRTTAAPSPPQEPEPDQRQDRGQPGRRRRRRHVRPAGNTTLNTTDVFGNRAGAPGGGIRRLPAERQPDQHQPGERTSRTTARA